MMTVPQENTQEQPETKQNDKEYNFAQIRKQLEQERQARMDLEKRLEEERSRPSAKESDDNDDDSNEPYIDKKTLEKKLARVTRDIDQKIDKRAEEKAKIFLEQEQQRTYLENNVDFDQILQPEMIQKYFEKFPNKAKALSRMPDTFDRRIVLYEDIKAHNLHRKEEAKPNIQETIDRNRRSPFYQPSMSAGQPPYAAVGDFTQTGQQNAYKKMQDLIKNRRS